VEEGTSSIAEDCIMAPVTFFRLTMKGFVGSIGVASPDFTTNRKYAMAIILSNTIFVYEV
jgi:hypothetical protein